MSEKTYKYETHMHTSQASACGVVFKEKWNDIHDFIAAVKNGGGYEIITKFEKQ